MFKKKYNNIIIKPVILPILAVFILAFFAVYFLGGYDSVEAQWIGPSSAPPSNNVAPPLRTDTDFSGQIIGKYNSLTLNGGREGLNCTTSDSIIWNGNSFVCGVAVSTNTLPFGTSSGQTLRYDGTKWVVASNLYNDGKNIGIGTTSPNVKLVVGNGSGNGNIIAINGADNQYSGLRLDNSGSEKWFIGTDPTLNTSDLIFRANSSNNYLTISSTGEVNIANKLCLGGVCRNTWPTSTTNTLPFGTSSGQTLRYDGTNKKWIAASNLYNNGTFIGIGTNAPTNFLHILGIESADNAGINIQVNKDRSYWTIYHDKLSQDLRFKNLGSSNSNKDLLKINLGGDIYSSGNTYVSGEIKGSWLHATSTSGTSTIKHDLVVDKRIYTIQGLCLGGVCRNTWPTSTTNTLPFGTSSGQTLRYDGTKWVVASNLYNDGKNIGIGTTSPKSLLDIEGGSSSSIDFPTIRIIDKYFGSSVSLIEKKGFFLSQEGNNPITIYTNGKERMIITGDGDIVIGTTSPPRAKLDVAGAISIFNNKAQLYSWGTEDNLVGGLRINEYCFKNDPNNENEKCQEKFVFNGPSALISLDQNGLALFAAKKSASETLFFNADPGLLFIGNNQKIGVNMSNPQEALDVNGAISVRNNRAQVFSWNNATNLVGGLRVNQNWDGNRDVHVSDGPAGKIILTQYGWSIASAPYANANSIFNPSGILNISSYTRDPAIIWSGNENAKTTQLHVFTSSNATSGLYFIASANLFDGGKAAVIQTGGDNTEGKDGVLIIAHKRTADKNIEKFLVYAVTSTFSNDVKINGNLSVAGTMLNVFSCSFGCNNFVCSLNGGTDNNKCTQVSISTVLTPYKFLSMSCPDGYVAVAGGGVCDNGNGALSINLPAGGDSKKWFVNCVDDKLSYANIRCMKQ